MKLQEAYFAEADSAGTWTLIGYTAPGNQQADNTYKSSNFVYSGAGVVGTGKEMWLAKNNVKLNECAVGDNWKLTVTFTAASATANSSLTINPNTPSDGCLALTPSFVQIGNGVASSKQSNNPTSKE